MYTLLGLCFLTYVLLESLIFILHTPWRVPFHLCLSFPDPVPTHPNPVPVLSPGHLSLLPLAVHFLLTPQFEEQILAQSCRYPACLAQFATNWNREFLHS